MRMEINQLEIGKQYCWNHEPWKALVYLGNNWSGNGYWHQFALADDPEQKVWCEITDKELPLIREIKIEGR